MKIKNYNNTLNPKDFQTDNMMDTSQPEITDGHETTDRNEVYPEGGGVLNNSMHNSWVKDKSHQSPMVPKKKKRGLDDTKSKISSYR